MTFKEDRERRRVADHHEVIGLEEMTVYKPRQMDNKVEDRSYEEHWKGTTWSGDGRRCDGLCRSAFTVKMQVTGP